MSAKEINERLGVKSNGGGMWSIYTGKNVCKQLPTKELWCKLQDILQFDIPYAKISQTYNTQLGITDVWDDINFYNEDRYHPTQKPQKAIERLILASSNKDDIVLDPFMGGGSTAVACVANNRSYIGFEVNQEYYNKSLERLAYSNIITPAQITNIVSIMSSGWHYVVNDGDTITCYKTKPWIDKEDGYYTRSITNINANKELFNFVKKGECVYLPDLIKGVLECKQIIC